MLPLPIRPSAEVMERIQRLEIPFNANGLDPYGMERDELARFLTGLAWIYRKYLDVRSFGTEHVPPRGRGMLVGNHSGGIALDGAMVIAAVFLEMEPPRLAQGMVEKFINRFPFGSLWSNRVGQFTGVPENAERLLENDRLLMVFPEGARGTAKLWWEQHSLVEFGTGFLRLAMQTGTPLIPFGCAGGGDAVPTVVNLYSLGKLVGLPYIPLTPYLLPLPIPRTRMELHFGAPLRFPGTGREADEVILGHVATVKARIQELVAQGAKHRSSGEDERTPQ